MGGRSRGVAAHRTCRCPVTRSAHFIAALVDRAVASCRACPPPPPPDGGAAMWVVIGQCSADGRLPPLIRTPGGFW